MVSEREIESDRMFNQMLLTDAEKAFLDRVWPKLQNGCYRTHGSIPVEIRGLNFNEFVRDGLCAVLSATPQPSGKIEEAAQIIQAFIDQEVDYIMRNNRVEEALHHLKIIEGEANRVTDPVTKNNLLYEIERIRSALTSSKPEQVPSGWKLVPEEPTEEMYRAVYKVQDDCAIHNYGASPTFDDYWSAALSASPAAPTAGGGDE